MLGKNTDTATVDNTSTEKSMEKEQTKMITQVKNEFAAYVADATIESDIAIASTNTSTSTRNSTSSR